MNLEIISPMHILLVSILGHRETYSFVVMPFISHDVF
jgi:hypothetical protein